MLMIKELWKIFKTGIFEENAVLVLLLGLCPALAVTTSTINGLGMGVALIFVLVCSELICSLVRSFISPRVRIPVFLSVIAGFVTITDMVMKAYTPELSAQLGMFIPLIVVNCLVLGRVEVFSSKRPPLHAAADAFGMGLGNMIILLAIGAFREILGDGKIFGFNLAAVFHYKPAILMILSPGGFFTIAIMMAGIAWLRKREILSKVARAFGVKQQDVLPEESPDEIRHADLMDKPL